MGQFDLKKYLVENKLTSNSRILKENRGRLMINGREVDQESLDVEWSRGRYADDPEFDVTEANFIDGTPLTYDELDELSWKYEDYFLFTFGPERIYGTGGYDWSTHKEEPY